MVVPAATVAVESLQLSLVAVSKLVVVAAAFVGDATAGIDRGHALTALAFFVALTTAAASATTVVSAEFTETIWNALSSTFENKPTPCTREL